jgi:glycogen debranching enzyme
VTDSSDVNAMARSVLDANRRVGTAQLPPVAYDYTCPSTQTYPFEWNWDSAFHAIALATYDPGRAQAEISTLLAAKQRSGFLPHMVLWQEEFRTRAADEFTIAVDPAGWHTLTTQPPVLPLAVEHVWQASRDERWLEGVLPDLVDVMSWWRTYRDPTNTGLVSTFQPDESGLDMSPKYDAVLGIATGLQGDGISVRWHAAMRKLFADYGAGRDPDEDLSRHGLFAWQDVMVNSIYANSAGALARLLQERGRSDAAAQWQQIAASTMAALLRDCWDESTGAFYDTYLSSAHNSDLRRTQVKILTFSSLFPLILDDLPSDAAARLVGHLTNEDEFWLPYPVPSVAAIEPTFDPHFATGAIFRGSSWVNLNWYLCNGLRAHGYDEIALELARRTREMIALSGLRECYDPYNGVGQGAHDFSWSSLVLDMS